MDPLSRVRFGGTDLRVTRLGLGLAPIGDLTGPDAPRRAVATVDRAWEQGLRLFDTAPYYGSGRSEWWAGSALRPRPRAGFVFSTKVGRLLRGWQPGSAPREGSTPYFDFSPEAVRRSLAASLDRTGLARADLVHLHDPDDHWEQAAGGALEALHDLRAAGEIGAVSVGMNQTAMLTRFVTERRVDGILVAGRYSLLDQSAADRLLPACAERGVGVLVGGVFNSSVLADPRPGATYDYAPVDAERLARARAIGAVCARYGVPLRAAAIQFPFGHPAVTAVLFGAKSPAEVDAALAAFRHHIPAELWRALQDGGLLPEAVPTPTPS
jgi:D-threo-aldose 1-dehydrogenase